MQCRVWRFATTDRLEKNVTDSYLYDIVYGQTAWGPRMIFFAVIDVRSSDSETFADDGRFPTSRIT